MAIDNVEDVVLVVGSKVEISCRSGGSRPHATITWWIDNDNLQGAVLMIEVVYSELLSFQKSLIQLVTMAEAMMNSI